MHYVINSDNISIATNNDLINYNDCNKTFDSLLEDIIINKLLEALNNSIFMSNYTTTFESTTTISPVNTTTTTVHTHDDILIFGIIIAMLPIIFGGLIYCILVQQRRHIFVQPEQSKYYTELTNV